MKWVLNLFFKYPWITFFIELALRKREDFSEKVWAIENWSDLLRVFSAKFTLEWIKFLFFISHLKADSIRLKPRWFWRCDNSLKKLLIYEKFTLVLPAPLISDYYHLRNVIKYQCC